MFPIEVDFDVVRRQRETGLMGLGQVLKSFRDSEAEFPIYNSQRETDTYLQSLGPLQMPVQGNRSGLDAPAPAAEPLSIVEQPRFNVISGQE